MESERERERGNRTKEAKRRRKMEKMESLERWRNEKKIGQTKVSRGSQEEKRDNPSNHREKEGPKKGGARDLSSVCRTVPWARDELGEPEQTQRHAQDRFVSVGKETNHRFRVQTYYKLSFTASARRGTER